MNKSENCTHHNGTSNNLQRSFVVRRNNLNGSTKCDVSKFGIFKDKFHLGFISRKSRFSSIGREGPFSECGSGIPKKCKPCSQFCMVASVDMKGLLIDLGKRIHSY